MPGKPSCGGNGLDVAQVRRAASVGASARVSASSAGSSMRARAAANSARHSSRERERGARSHRSRGGQVPPSRKSTTGMATRAVVACCGSLPTACFTTDSKAATLYPRIRAPAVTWNAAIRGTARHRDLIIGRPRGIPSTVRGERCGVIRFHVEWFGRVLKVAATALSMVALAMLATPVLGEDDLPLVGHLYGKPGAARATLRTPRCRA